MVESRAGRAEEKAAGAGKNAAAVQRLRPVLEAVAASVKDLIREAESPSGSAWTGAPVAVGEAGEQVSVRAHLMHRIPLVWLVRVTTMGEAK